MTEPKVIQVDPDSKYLIILDDPDRRLSYEQLTQMTLRLQEWWNDDRMKIPMVLIDHGFNLRLEKLEKEVVGE